MKNVYKNIIKTKKGHPGFIPGQPSDLKLKFHLFLPLLVLQHVQDDRKKPIK